MTSISDPFDNFIRVYVNLKFNPDGSKDKESMNKRPNGWKKTEVSIYNGEPNYAILTGNKNGIVVIDIDNKNGKDGNTDFETIFDKKHTDIDTLTTKTPSNGFHLFFKWNNIEFNKYEYGGVEVMGNEQSILQGYKYDIIKNVPIIEMPDDMKEIILNQIKHKETRVIDKEDIDKKLQDNIFKIIEKELGTKDVDIRRSYKNCFVIMENKCIVSGKEHSIKGKSRLIMPRGANSRTYIMRCFSCNERIVETKDNIKGICDDEYRIADLFIKENSNILKTDGKSLWARSNKRYWTNITDEVDSIIRNRLNDNYKGYKGEKGTITSFFSRILKAIRDKMIEEFADNHFIKSIRENAKGYICFRNGFLNEKLQFTKWTDEDLYNTSLIQRDYIPIEELRDNEDYIKADKFVRKIMSDIFDNNEELEKETCQFFARAVFGYASDKYYLLGTGSRNSGKGIITLLFKTTFEEYIGSVDSKNLYQKDFGGEGARENAFLIDFFFKRLMFGNEIDNGKQKINGTILKTIGSGGDDFEARRIYEKETGYCINALLVLFANNIRDVEPKDALENMLKLDMPCYFDEKENGNKLGKFKPEDKLLKDKIKKTKYLEDAFFNYIVSFFTSNPKFSLLKEKAEEYRSLEDDEGDNFKNLKLCINPTRDLKDIVYPKQLKEHLGINDVQNGIREVKRWIEQNGGIYGRDNKGDKCYKCIKLIGILENPSTNI